MALRVVNVKYGTESDNVDVTHILRLLQQNQIYKITVGPSVFTEDPAPKKQKELIIKFSNKKYKKYTEGSICSFEPDSMIFPSRTDKQKTDKIMSKYKDIYYGYSGNYMTVTQIIRNHIELGNTEIKISTTNMHHDHCFGKVKNLMAFMTDGRIIYIAYGNTFHTDGHKSINRSSIEKALVSHDRSLVDVTIELNNKTQINVDDLLSKLNMDSVLKIIMKNKDIYVYKSGHIVNINL